MTFELRWEQSRISIFRQDWVHIFCFRNPLFLPPCTLNDEWKKFKSYLCPLKVYSLINKFYDWGLLQRQNRPWCFSPSSTTGFWINNFFIKVRPVTAFPDIVRIFFSKIIRSSIVIILFLIKKMCTELKTFVLILSSQEPHDVKK